MGNIQTLVLHQDTQYLSTQDIRVVTSGAAF